MGWLVSPSTDWDRRELIVPNKAFLSEKVINWSLSDDVSRLVIDVGIGYGSDTARAEELMLEIAKQNPPVLEEPAPSVVFSGFGADWLDFKLRVFVALSDRVKAKTRIRPDINNMFKQAGIEIPFAQRDTHLDTSAGPVEIRMVDKKRIGRVEMKHFLKLLVLGFFVAQAAWAGLEIGQVPAKVELKDRLGGRLDNTPWSSDELRGKVHVIFYVDPDEKDLNNEASEALEVAKFPGEKFQSWGIINMAATWLPNFAISSGLKEKQKRYTTTIYVRDYKKVLVKKWGIADDNSDVLAFDKTGRLIFKKDGKLDQGDIEGLLKAIRAHIDR